MSRKITNFLLILVILVALGLGFYFGNQKFTFFQSLFSRSQEASLSTEESGSSDTIAEEEQGFSLPESSSSMEDVTKEVAQQQIEIAIPSEPVKSEIVSESPVVQKPLTLSEIKEKIDEISSKVEILKIELAKYLAEKQLQEMRYAEIQNQISDIAVKIDALSRETTEFAMSGSNTPITTTPILIEDINGSI